MTLYSQINPISHLDLSGLLTPCRFKTGIIQDIVLHDKLNLIEELMASEPTGLSTPPIIGLEDNRAIYL